jgi:hypothetical protein
MGREFLEETLKTDDKGMQKGNEKEDWKNQLLYFGSYVNRNMKTVVIGT